MQSGNITADGKTNEMYHASIVAGLVVQKLKKYPNIEVFEIPIGWSLNQTIAEINRRHPICVIDLHTNAGGGHGCTILCLPQARKFAECIYKYLSATTPDNDRGIHDGSEFGIPNAGGIIAEMLFHDCPVELAWYKQHYNELAIAIEKGIVEYLGLTYIPDGEEVKKVKYIVCYDNYINQRAAEYLADALECPTISSERKFDYSNVETVYCVGEKATVWTSYMKRLFSGSDRYTTMDEVREFINNGCK
jgi:hypothetical protein